MKHARRVGGLASALLVVSLVCGAAAQTSFEAVLEASFDELDVPGLGFAVVEGGAVSEEGGLGVADAATGEAVTAETPFRVASLTKPLSAALLLNAVHAGEADLDTPLREASSKFRSGCLSMKAYFKLNGLPYLDDVACGDDAITVRHVLTHTAKTPPGGAYAYNGFLFGLLSDEVGDVTIGGGDDNFLRAVRERIIEPLDLKRAAAGITDPQGQEVVAELAPPHERAGGEWVALPPLEDPLNAGAGFFASAGDMARIDVAYRDELLADPSIWERMTTPTELSGGTSSPYGMGWFVQSIDGRQVVWHYGHQPGAYSALWIKDVERGRGIVLLANSDGLAAGEDLHLGDLTRSPIAVAFLSWPASREAG